MPTRLLRIRRADVAAQERFHAFVPLTFRSVDFRLWDRRGGWNDDYEAWLLLDGDDTVASVGVMRMRLSIGGRVCVGYQLGAVSTHPDRRGRGHSRELLQQVLGWIDALAAPALLFANEGVREFYPRFGFRPLPQQRYFAETPLAGGTALPPCCDVANARDRARLAELCRRAAVHDAQFGAGDYYSALLWHLSYRALRAHWLDDVDALAVVSEENGTLHLHELLTPQRFDLHAVLPRLARQPAERIEFGFQPRHWWAQTLDAGECKGSPLFVRGLDTLLPGALRFPDLAQT